MSLFRMHLDMSTAYSWKRNPKRKLGHYKDAVKWAVFNMRHQVKLKLIRLEYFVKRHQWKLVLALVLGHIYEGVGIATSFLSL